MALWGQQPAMLPHRLLRHLLFNRWNNWIILTILKFLKPCCCLCSLLLSIPWGWLWCKWYVRWACGAWRRAIAAFTYTCFNWTISAAVSTRTLSSSCVIACSASWIAWGISLSAASWWQVNLWRVRSSQCQPCCDSCSFCLQWFLWFSHLAQYALLLQWMNKYI